MLAVSHVPATADYSGWLAAAFSGMVVVGGVVSFLVASFRRAIAGVDAKVTELGTAVKEELEALEIAQQETKTQAVRALAQAETLVAVFSSAGQPGGQRRYDPPTKR